MPRRLATLLLALGLLAGCGEEQVGDGAAQLWITRDRGTEVVLTTTVPAGLSAMEALRRRADVETRYGGRFVHAIDGIEGDSSEQHDWFYFVNGYEADLSAADYTLQDGDVLWWDHRSWEQEMRQPVVVGAFPQPFTSGWDGVRRTTVVQGKPVDLARQVADTVGGRLGGAGRTANLIQLVAGSRMRARLSGSGNAGDPVFMELGRRTAKRLLDEPNFARYRYEIP